MNAVQYDCERSEGCDYQESLRGIGNYKDGTKRSIYSQKFREKRSMCTRPTLDSLGERRRNYPQAEGGFKLE